MSSSLSHASAARGVLDTVGAIATFPRITDEELSALLQSRGYSKIQAEKLNAFVPSAFAYVLLHKMGVSLPSTYVALSQTGESVSLPIAGEHYFTTALDLAHHTCDECYAMWTRAAADPSAAWVLRPRIRHKTPGLLIKDRI